MLSHFVRKLRSFVVADTPSVRVGSLLWHLTPAAVDLFGETVPDITAWEANGSVVVVKQNGQRTISRVALPGGTVYLKRCRTNTPRAWGREILRPPKAQLEFENTTELQTLGIPCAQPLAWAKTNSGWPGDSILLTRECPNAVPFDTVLNHRITSAERRRLARKLGSLFAQIHDAGVAHPDPHPGNFLFDGTQFILIDVHAVRFGPPLTWLEARENLVLFNRWFQVRATRIDRARFWRSYISARTTLGLPDSKRLAREVESATAASNLRFWASRTARYLGNNRQYRQVKAGNIRGHAVREWPDEVVQAWLTDPDAVFTQSGVKLLKDSRSSTVALAPLSPGGDGSQIIFKRFRINTPLAAVKNLFRRSAALRSWVFGHNLLDRHLPTPRPVFVAHRYRFGIPHEGYIAFEQVPGAIELPDAVQSASEHELRELSGQLARLIRSMHERQVSHRDLKAPNILIAGPTRKPVLIDLVGLTVGRPVSEADRIQNLSRLNASFLNSAAVSHTVRLRFLRVYLNHSKDWKTWWIRIAAATDEKRLKNLHSGRPLA
jgi:tRNA A-37 threonylcarbamoyl transferase component Bud32